MPAPGTTEHWVEFSVLYSRFPLVICSMHSNHGGLPGGGRVGGCGEVFWGRLHAILEKKIRDTMATFHAKMGSIKDRNAMDLTEAEDIKKR